MTPPLTLHSTAKAEIQEAYDYYEQQRPGLGHQFLLAVRRTLAAVEKTPLLYPKIRKEVRRAPVRRFPYTILYLAEPENTVVIACFHGRRNPKRWHSRN
jgi:plasmid stabilization system protein ParE